MGSEKHETSTPACLQNLRDLCQLNFPEHAIADAIAIQNQLLRLLAGRCTVKVQQHPLDNGLEILQSIGSFVEPKFDLLAKILTACPRSSCTWTISTRWACSCTSALNRLHLASMLPTTAAMLGSLSLKPTGWLRLMPAHRNAIQSWPRQWKIGCYHCSHVTAQKGGRVTDP